MNPEISVIIAVCNGEKFLKETLESILYQTFTNWECIVVDDGSTDTTLDIIGEFIAKDNRFRLIKTPGGNGPYIAANKGIKDAQGEYIARTDADDISMPNRLAIQHNYLKSNININVCGTLHYYLFEDGKTIFKPYNTDILFLKWQLIFRNKIVHSTMMVRKNWFEKIGYYPEKPLAQDWHIWLEAINNDTLHVINTPLVNWRIHHNSITKTQNSKQLIEALDVAFYNLKYRMNINSISLEAVTAIIASIRGDLFLPQTSLKITVDNLILAYRHFKSKNQVNRFIKNEFHFTLDTLFTKYPKRSVASVITYLQTIFVAGISISWARGFFRHLFKL